jgi:hypothetical protein
MIRFGGLRGLGENNIEEKIALREADNKRKIDWK